MTKPPQIETTQSTVGHQSKPLLSVLVPFYNDDPIELLQSLLQQVSGSSDIEILIYDDGTGDKAINDRVIETVKNAQSPARLLVASENRGRSFARNTLKDNAKADWVLFLDADMRPVSDQFTSTYAELIKSDAADIIFGGFTVPENTPDPERELHRAFSEISDCLTLDARQLAGPQYVCSSNLCVRKTVLDAEPFDHEFTGWGWEDSEWAARAGARFTLMHADNPALHLGLETTDTLLRRFKDSGSNYLRFTRKHPELARTLTLYNVIQKLRRVPGQKLMRPFLRLLVKLRFAPVNIRLNALKLWRASWYAEAF